MELLGSVISGVLGVLFSIIWWVLSQLFWLMLWFVLPFCILAYGAMRLAENALGKTVVRTWIKRHTLRWGQGTWARLRPALFAVSVLPFRVSSWLVVYTLWHSVLSLFWTPRWTPWQRAWKRRWRTKTAVGKGRQPKSARGAA